MTLCRMLPLRKLLLLLGAFCFIMCSICNTIFTRHEPDYVKHSMITIVESHRSRTAVNAATFPVVDAVFTWVNGSEPHFLTQLANYTGKPSEQARYRDIGQLRYGLRSILQYAPWICHIFLVVSDRESQTPSWLNASHPKISVVEHSDIWKDPSQLPNFNSHCIESNLHRVPGAAPDLLYFNDDFALTKPLLPYQHLWAAPGVPILYEAWEVPVWASSIIPGMFLDEYFWALVHTKNLVDARDGREKRRKAAAHVPFLFSRTIMEELQNEWKPEYDKMHEARLRTKMDMQFQSLYNWYIQSNSNILQHEVRDHTEYLHFFPLTDFAAWNAIVFATIRMRPKQFVCLQDSFNHPSPRVLSAIRDFYEDLFPVPAPWEI